MFHKQKEGRFLYREDRSCFTDYNPRFMSICYIKSGNVWLRIDGVSFFISAPHILCLNTNMNIEFLSTFKLKAFSMLFLPNFLDRKTDTEEKEEDIDENNEVYGDDIVIEDDGIDEEDDTDEKYIPPLQMFRSKSYLYHCVLPIEDWMQSIADDFYGKCADEYIRVDDERCCLEAHVILLIELVNIMFTRYISSDEYFNPELLLIENTVDYIKVNFAKNITLDEMCTRSNMNRNKLNKLFSKHKKATVNGYITKCRVNHAQNLLFSTDLSLDTIAEQCGYKFTSYFSRVFKKETGTTPAEFRAKRT